ncbi:MULTISPECIES: universal stress protein [unclassified Algibacter]|uniref:universal stress protein n=1 Tax=unclassified Algibacter TaxID=2615009 RepID=UPI00131A65A9|nr:MULTISPECIES: universal stress protein [unclassified Algibacter]MCL5128281.1 universal stress protein [Algibacter sp. L4_22]
MKTILYATDCTKNDASALKYAYRFSYIMKANLHVMHVYDVPPVSISVIKRSDVLKNNMIQEQKDIVTKYCETHLKNEFRENPIKIHVVENISVENAILDISKKLSPDLVLLGIKDTRSHRTYFSSNIANILLDKIEVPVMMIPNGMVYKSISTIVYATDFEKEDILPIKKLIEIVSPFEALIEVVHIYKTDTTTAKEKMVRFKSILLEQISYKEITFKTMAATKIKSGLVSVLDNEKASMLAMLERKHSLSLDNLFHRDLVREMEEIVTIPILAFNKHNTKLKEAVTA